MALTPEQFNKIALKEDLKEFANRTEIKEMFKEVMASINIIAKKIDDIEHAFVSNQAAHDRFEKRITRTEKRLELSPMLD